MYETISIKSRSNYIHFIQQNTKIALLSNIVRISEGNKLFSTNSKIHDSMHRTVLLSFTLFW